MNPNPEYREHVKSLLEEAYASRVNNLKHSIELAQQALYTSREFNDSALIGQSLNQLALYFMIVGEHDKATTMSREAIKYFEELNDEKGIANAKYNIAGIYYKTDNYHLGLIYLMECIQTYQKFNDYHNISRAEKSLGTIYEYFGDTNNAIKAYENAIAAAAKAGDLNLESNAYNNLSGVFLKQGKIHKALDLIERSISMKKQTGDIRGSAFAIYGRGKVRTRMVRYLDAEKDFLEAISIHKEMGERLGLGMAYHKLGGLYTEMGLLTKAKETAQLGLDFSKEYNIVFIKFKCDYLLYRINKLENNAEKALKSLEGYLRQKETVINTQTLKVIENYDIILQMKTLEQEAQMQREKAEIIEKKNRAEEAARIRQEFLSTMSHEIRTPLNAVTTIVSMLSGKSSDEEDKQLLDTLKFASNNLLRIINDILDFTKLDSGKEFLETRETNFKELMKNIWRTYDPLARDKNIILSLKMDSDIGKSYILDETRLMQVMGNLISNAIKFTESGRIGIEIQKTGSANNADRLLFSISDTGEGIPEEDIDKIFESFSQTKPVTTRKQGGTGLGLAIVKKILEMHGSEIKVESAPGKGSVFSFELTLENSFSYNTNPSDYSDKLKDKIALVAEDNEINALLVRKLLSKWGVASEHATNGRNAVEMAKQKPYDFILMDIHMPEMNGFDATMNIRTIENPNIQTPIFALTADITAPGQEKYSSYFNGFLWKPLQIEKLFEALAKVMV